MRKVAVITVLLVVTAVAYGVTLTNDDLVGSWNVAGTYATGIGYGTATFANATPPYGERTGGTHVRVFYDGNVDTDAVDCFNSLANSFDVTPSGIFYGAEDDTNLTSMIGDTNPSNRVIGVLSGEDTDPNQAFLALILRGAGTDDLFVGIKPHTRTETEAIGGTQAIIVGAALTQSRTDSFAVKSLFSIRRLSDTLGLVRTYDLDSTVFTVDTIAGVFDTSGAIGAGGQYFFLPELAATTAEGGSAGSFMASDTGSRYRIVTTYDTNLAVIVRDTANVPVSPADSQVQFIAFAVQADTSIDTADLFGPWQVGAVTPETGQFNGIFGFFEMKGDGTGTFDNGEPDPAFHWVTSCTFVVKSDVIGGIVPTAIPYYEISFQPDSVADPVLVRTYISNNGAFISGAGNRAQDDFIVVGMKRANTVENTFVFGDQDTPIQQAGFQVGMIVDTGATDGSPTFAFSPIDTGSNRIVSFQDFRDTPVKNQGVDSIVGGISIIPDTTVDNPDSVTITIDLRGSSEDTGNGAGLLPLVYNDSTGLWEQIPPDSVTYNAGGLMVFNPPHFSDFGAGVGASSSSSSSGSSGGCIIEHLSFPEAAIAPLRVVRDLVMASFLGRLLTLLYYFLG